MLQETSRTLSLAAAATTVIAFLALSDVAYGLAAGGTVTAIKLRGRKWNYSPITDAEYSNGDFIHIRGGCADDTAFLQPQANFSVEFWFKFAPEEYFSGSNVPHSFAMAQEYNFWMQYLIPIGGGESAWFGNWLSPCGWLTVIKSSPYAWDISPLVKQPAHTWMHIAVVNDNNNITAYINGTAVSNMYCAAKFDSAPVWTIGIRDWATDVAQKNQLSPIFPMTGEFSEFRVWTRPISLTEITSRMHRSLLANELADKNLMIYFDFNNITDGYIIQDMSPTKRLAGYMGGALGLEINTPELVPSTAPIVNISTTLVTMTMKESGDNPSSAKVPLVAIDVRTPAFSLLTASTPVTYTLTSLPDPSVLILTAGSGSASRILSGSLPISLGSSFDVTVTHRVNNAVSSWPAQRFNVSITFGGTTVVVPVVVNILKNAAPTVGDSGGAIAPPDEPPSSTQKPIYIPNFTWRNATYNTPLTFEFWTVGAESDRYIDLPDMSYAGKGRMNTEVNKNLVMDYGWDYDGSGRTVIPWRRKFGIWNHVAMISTGLRGRQWMYVNGNLVAQTTGNVAMRNNDRGLPPSNMTGFIDAMMVGNVVMDEFRVWNIARTPEQLRATMATKLTGKEPGLYMYHNFDSYTVQPDNSYVFRDLGPYGFDLICRGYFKNAQCPYTRSSIPMGGTIQDLTFQDGSNVTLWNPLGHDVDDDTNYLRFVVSVLPTDAKMFADKNQTFRSLDGDIRNGFATPNYITPITVGALIRKMQLIPSVQIVPSADGGGNPYDSFQYYVTDGLRNSKSATIQIYRKCWPGTYLDQSKRKCLPCSPGFFSTGYSYNTVCTPCPVGTSQPRAGSSTCVPCQQAVFISYTANATSINSTSSNNTFVPSSSTIKLPSTVVGIEDISSFGSFQEGTGQATCNACAGLTYALVEKATSCEGKAFIPKYVSLGGGSSSAYPSVSGMILGSGSSSFSSLISVLNPAYRTNDVSSAMDKAMILDAPRAVVVTGCLIAGITLLGLIGTFLFINDPVIKASSPIALSITAAGIIMGALSVVTYSVEPSKGSCIAEIWMLPVSFSIVIGMLISKTFRILRIFNNPRALKIRMTNADLFGYMVAATSGNVAILIIWSIFDPPTPVVISRGNSDGMNFIYCGSKSAAVQSGFTAVLYLYNAALLVILAILAFLTRTVNALFSESKFIGYFVAATVFAVSLFLPILYFLTNDVSAMYVIKSVAILIITGAASATLIGIKFYSIFRNRQQQAAGVPTQSQKNSMISSQTSAPTVDKNGKMAINSAYLQLLKTSASTLVANCVYPTKKVGVVFWNSKIAVLQPEQRLLFILSPDAAAPPKGPPPVPETLVFPLTKFSVSTPESGGGSNHLSSTTTANSATSNSQSQSQSQQDGVAAASNATPIVTVTNNDTGHSVTLQFESTQVKKEWQTLLTQLSDGKYAPRADLKNNVVATAKMEV